MPVSSDPRQVVVLMAQPQYRDGASPEARDAAVAAVEQAGLGGTDLDRAAASLH